MATKNEHRVLVVTPTSCELKMYRVSSMDFVPMVKIRSLRRLYEAAWYDLYQVDHSWFKGFAILLMNIANGFVSFSFKDYLHLLCSSFASLDCMSFAPLPIYVDLTDGKLYHHVEELRCETNQFYANKAILKQHKRGV